jgi:hypothetical protein
LSRSLTHMHRGVRQEALKATLYLAQVAWPSFPMTNGRLPIDA